MRLDLFLKTSRIMPRRSLAQEFCDAGLVRLNGVKAKPSKEVKIGDEILIKRRDRRTTIRILALPTSKQVAKSVAATLFEVVGEETLPDDLFGMVG